MGLLDMFGGMNNYGTNPDAEMKRRAQMASLGSLADGLLQAGFAGNDWSKFGQGIAGGVRGMGDAYKKSLMEDEQLRYQRNQRDYQMDAQADEKKKRKEQIEKDDAMDSYNTTALPALQESAAKMKQMILDSPNIPEEQKQGIISRGEFLLNRAIKGTYKDSDGQLKIVPKAVEDLDKFVDETGVLVGNSALREMLANESQEKTIGNQGYLLEDLNGSIEINGKRYKADIDAWTQARRDRDQSVIENNRTSAYVRRMNADNPKPNTSTDGKPTDSALASVRGKVFDDLSKLVAGEISKDTAFYEDDDLLDIAGKYNITNAIDIGKLKRAWKTDPSSVINQFADRQIAIMYPGEKPKDQVQVAQEKKDFSNVQGNGEKVKPTNSQLIQAIAIKGKDEVIKKLVSDGMSEQEATNIVERLSAKGNLMGNPG